MLLGEQRGGFLGGRAGVDFVLGGGLDHAGRRFLVLGMRALLLERARRGTAAPSGSGSLTASRTSSQPFFAPGTEPLTKIRPRVDVGADDFEVLLGALLVTHVAGHLLVLEDLARILALTGRTERTVRDRDAVGGAHAAEAPALHAALAKPLPCVWPETSTIWPAMK